MVVILHSIGTFYRVFILYFTAYPTKLFASCQAH